MIIKNKNSRLIVSILVIFLVYFIFVFRYSYSKYNELSINFIEALVATPFVMLITFPISFSMIRSLSRPWSDKKEPFEEKKIVMTDKIKRIKKKKPSFYKVMFISAIIMTIIVLLVLINSGPFTMNH